MTKITFLKELHRKGAISDQAFQNEMRLLAKQSVAEQQKQVARQPKRFHLTDKPPCGYFKTYETDTSKYKHPYRLFNDFGTVLGQIKKDLTEYKGIKISIGISIKFYHDEGWDRRIVTNQTHGEQTGVLKSDGVSELYN